jgi:hypothetical protein
MIPIIIEQANFPKKNNEKWACFQRTGILVTVLPNNILLIILQNSGPKDAVFRVPVCSPAFLQRSLALPSRSKPNQVNASSSFLPVSKIHQLRHMYWI